MVALMLGVQAQEKVPVTGKVINAATKAPLEGVTVQVKGTNSGTTTNQDGEFAISALPNSVITISGVGYSSKEVTVTGNGNLIVELTESSGQLEGVVVTALGLNRQKRDLGYATQQIGGADLQIGRENNVANALVGRTAGVVINRSSAGPGSSTRISLRGERSIRGDNGPLIVIDGVPVDNSVRGGTGEFGGSDGGDAIGNLVPDDIESMNILRGPNAAALYGARANNGVIMITTKKGRKQKGIGLSYNNNTAFESPLYKIDMQKAYAQGSGGNYNPTDENSWGPRITGQQIVNWKGQTHNAVAQDHVGEFLKTGVSTTNNVALSAGNEKTQVRFAYNHLYATGLVPNNSQDRHSFTLRSTSDFGKLNVDAKINYINQTI
jgi:TonB-dependent SusC/RagA subfamily outer membrane receptor